MAAVSQAFSSYSSSRTAPQLSLLLKPNIQGLNRFYFHTLNIDNDSLLDERPQKSSDSLPLSFHGEASSGLPCVCSRSETSCQYMFSSGVFMQRPAHSLNSICVVRCQVLIVWIPPCRVVARLRCGLWPTSCLFCNFLATFISDRLTPAVDSEPSDWPSDTVSLSFFPDSNSVISPLMDLPPL